MDVTVYPPPATWGKKPDAALMPTPEELVQMQQVELRRLKADLARLHQTANTIANIAAFLIWEKTQTDPVPSPKAEVRVPREFRDRFGSRIRLTAGREGDEIVARYTLRADGHDMGKE